MNKSEITGIKKVIGNATYEIIPTEKGYGYMICAVLCIVNIILFSYVNSIGLLYKDLLEDIGAGPDGLSTVIGIYMSFVSVTGIITNAAMKKITLRKVGFFGALLYTSGWFLTSFVRTMPQLIITYCFMQGVGNGILFTISFAIFGTYFVSHKKVTVMSICQLIISSTTMLFPLLLKKLFDEYGYRGTILILSGCIAHCLFAVACMHPVEWHSEKRLLYKTIDQCKYTIDLNEEKLDHDVTKLKFIDEKLEDQSLKNSSTKQKNTMGKLSIIAEFLDLTLLKDITFVSLLIGLTVGLMFDAFYFSLFPSYLYDLGFDTESIAILLAVLGGADLSGRVFLAVFSKYYKIRSELIFYYSILLISIFRFCFFFCKTYATIIVILLPIGFLKAIMVCAYPLVYIDYTPEKFPAALGMGMLSCGCMSIPCLLIIGNLRNYTGNHTAGYIFLTVINLVCMIPWTIKLCYYKKLNKGKNNT